MYHKNLTSVLGMLIVILLLGGLQALFLNFVIGLFVDYPITWSNWGKTLLVMICFNMIFRRAKTVKK